MAGWYEIRKNDRGRFSFVLKAGNNEVILRSEQYASKAAAHKGIASVRVNCASADRYLRKHATDGRPYFNLRARNNQVVGTSQMYASASGRDNGVASVASHGPSTTVKDLSR